MSAVEAPLRKSWMQPYDALYSADNTTTEDEASPQDQCSPPCAVRWLESPFHFSVGSSAAFHPEATGWAMDSAAKGPLHFSAFLGPALISLATIAATSCNDDDNVDCSNGDNSSSSSNIVLLGIHMRPSSILATSSVIVTLSAAVLLPILGALVDHSPHRKTVGAVTAAALVILNALQIMISQPLWRFVWYTLTLCDFLYFFHTTIALSYLRGLTNDDNHLAMYTSHFAICQYSFTVFYVIILIAYSKHQHASLITTARLAHAISSIVGAVLLGYAWTFLFGNRPAIATQTEEDEVGLLTGKKQNRWHPCTRTITTSWLDLLSTLTHIRKDYPQLTWFLVTLLFSPDVGTGSHLSLFSTYLASLSLSAAQIGISHALVLVGTIPGARIGRWLCQYDNPLSSFRRCLVIWAITTLVASVFVTPNAMAKSPAATTGALHSCNLVWGMAVGWLVTTQRVLYCMLTPPQRETEFMGLVMSMHSWLAWLPPLVFGWIDSAFGNTNMALLSQDVFLALALVASLPIGPYDTAVQRAMAQPPLLLQQQDLFNHTE